MKNFILLALLLCNSVSLYAQKNLQMGPMIKIDKEKYWADLEHISTTAKGSYFVLVPIEKLVHTTGIVIGSKHAELLGRFNPQTMVIEQVAPIPDLPDMNSKLEFVVQQGESIITYLSVKDKRKDKIRLFAQKINSKNLAPNGRAKEVLAVDFPEDKFKHINFTHEFSPDKSQLLVSYSLTDKKNYLVSFGYLVLDDQQTATNRWAKSFQMEDGIYSMDQFRIANDGTVYLLTTYYPNKKMVKKSTDLEKNGLLSNSRSFVIEPNFEHRLISFGQGDQLTITPISYQDKFLITTDIITTAQGLMAMSFFGAHESTVPEGMVVLSMNKKGEVLQQDAQVLPGSFSKPSNEKNKTKGFLSTGKRFRDYRFTLNEVLYKSDGGYVFSGERTMTHVISHKDGSGNVTLEQIDHTDDIALLDISAQGKINAFHRIEKAQEASGVAGLMASYKLMEQNGQLFCFFTELNKKTVKWGKWTKTEAIMVRIDQNGQMNRSVLFDADQADVTIKANDTFLTDRGDFVFLGAKNIKNWRFIRYNPDSKLRAEIEDEE
ncbi:hypothetical protein [Persicobacter diffluens]|uniref:Phytase-like domain-containing protein n=1 Tax=Persicobacter diffluens TaxID=981 RepID=A0AAN4VY05_9BACT|nr:hypothetical protein PEDI_15750 [Persicobacter diffluens]